ncbi:MAG TPA: LysR family transcriptional regulator [Ideonella sp.]|nr:LysR family transcriptional regulator [Ideonella sp.]
MNKPSSRPLSPDFLRSFEAVARRLSFSAAAEDLHLTQPAISRQIKSLEEELGAPLFHRGTRKVELTQAGHSLLRSVEPLLARLDATVRQIRLARGRAQVSVSTFPSFATLWLMPRLADFERRHPGIDIRLSATDRMAELDDPDLDLLLRHCPPERAPAGAERMFGEVLTPVIGARMADAIARGDAPPLARPADLTQHTLVEVEDTTPSALALSWPNWLAAQGQAQLVPRRWISVNFNHQQIQAVLAGQGVALAWLPMVHDALSRGELVEPFGREMRWWPRYAYYLVPLAHRDARAPRPELTALIDFVREHAEATQRAIGEVNPENCGPTEGD